MSLYRLLRRSTATSVTSPFSLLRSLNHLTLSPTPTPTTTPRRTYAFSSAEEAAAERRRRKRRLRIEPPMHALRRDPNPPPRDPNAPRLPDSTSALVGPRLNLHNRVQSLIRAFDLDAASLLARNSVYTRTRPTVFTCNAIIAAMYRAKRYNDAIALFKYFFEQHNIVPNIVSYNNLINAHCDEGRVDVGIEIYRHIIATAPFSPSPVTYRHLTKGLIDAGRIQDAVDLLREMLTKGHGADSLVFNNLIKGFLELGNFEKANEFFDELKERCLVYDGAVSATFMEWWFKQGKDKEAMESYKSLMDKNFRMVPATCNVLLEVLLKYGKKEKARDLFLQMLDNHTPPTFQAVNSDTFNIMVNECFEEGKFSEAKDTFKMAGTAPRSKPFAMDVAGYNNMITRFSENGMLEEAEQYFDELCSKSLSPDVTSFKTLIDAHLRVERIDDALRFFKKMVEAGLHVVATFGTKWFGELIRNGKVLDSAQILTKMGERDPKPDVSLYEVVARGLCDASEFDTGKNVVEQMMGYGVGVPPALKEFLLSSFKNAGRGEEIERALDENRWRNTSGPPHAQRQPRNHWNPSPPSRDRVFVPSQMVGQSQQGQLQKERQNSFGGHQMPGQIPSGSFQVASQQPLASYNLPGRQQSESSQMVEKQPSQSPFAHNQMSGQTQMWGQPQTWSSEMKGQQPSWSSQGGGQQSSWSSSVGGQQSSWSSSVGGQQSSWSSPVAGHQPPGSSQAGWQTSGEPQVREQLPSWSSNAGQRQPTYSSQNGGQESSWPSQGGQQLSWSSQVSSMHPGETQMDGYHQNGSPHMSTPVPHGFSQNSRQYPYGSPSMGEQHSTGHSQMSGQPQWQDEWQKAP